MFSTHTGCLSIMLEVGKANWKTILRDLSCPPTVSWMATNFQENQIMAVRNLKYELITNASARKLTFGKRKAGLLKKLKELTTLCGILACAVIFSAYESCPDVWPSAAEAFIVLEKLKNLPPRKQGKYIMNEKSFLTINITKLNVKLEKQKKKNRKAKLDLAFAECFSGENIQYVRSCSTMTEISNLLTEKFEFIERRIECAKDKIKE